MGKANAVMRVLQYLVVMKRKLLKKAKLSVFKTVFVPSILIYGHEFWKMTERTKRVVKRSSGPPNRLLPRTAENC